ncbi:MAG: TAXI family TRAP transporter solute-binding subunit [Ahrensia sp.]|nr:TAXI family TRAP transporter solute-binding subunit [Ahrensia sp.]
MKLFTLAATAIAVVMTAGIASAMDVDKTGWPASFTVGTGSQGGLYFTYGSGFGKLISDDLGVPGAGEVTGGPMQNMALVHAGEAAFGMTTMGPADESLKGNNAIAPGLKMDKACAMFPMYLTPFGITTLSSKGINSVSEIPAGAKIGFGPAGSTSDTYFPAMLEALGRKI